MSEITVIGGTVLEIKGHPHGQLLFADENPAAVSGYYSGTGRNIAENLGRLGASCGFITAVGNDFAGKGAERELAALSVDTAGMHLIDGQNTAMHVELRNLANDLEMAVVGYDVFRCMDENLLRKSMDKLNGSKIVALDATMPEEGLQYLTEQAVPPLFLDPATEADAEKCREWIGAFHTIAPNRAEASAICGLEILSESQLAEAGKWFSDRGVSRVFITLGGGGVYYKEGTREGLVKPKVPGPTANQEGAGAAFSAAALYGFIQNMEIEELVHYAMGAAAIALEIEATVNPAMCVERLGR